MEFFIFLFFPSSLLSAIVPPHCTPHLARQPATQRFVAARSQKGTTLTHGTARHYTHLPAAIAATTTTRARWAAVNDGRTAGTHYDGNARATDVDEWRRRATACRAATDGGHGARRDGHGRTAADAHGWTTDACGPNDSTYAGASVPPLLHF